ncbi:hypothetical protein JX266_014363 [Neoarthrinium moseri]|nr:hypothetical protein JX266_014363 [Neoarthrinium moseri]
MSTRTLPEIFLFSLGDEQLLEATHGSLLRALAAKSNLSRALNAKEALGLLDQNRQPKGILVADPSIVGTKYNELSRALTTYVKNGGTVVLGGVFSALIRPNDLGRYMHDKWELPWKSGSYHRTTLFLNQEELRRPEYGLLPSYSQKAVFLKHVDPALAWYAASDHSAVESSVPLPLSEIDLLETPVAFANIEDGNLGYVGDVNGEEGTKLVVLKMFGLT